MQLAELCSKIRAENPDLAVVQYHIPCSPKPLQIVAVFDSFDSEAKAGILEYLDSKLTK